jgi:hypothetical protein
MYVGLVLNPHNERASLPTSLQQISQMQKRISNTLKCHDVGRYASMREVGAALKVQRTYLEAKRKVGASAKKRDERPKIRQTIVRISVCLLFLTP